MSRQRNKNNVEINFDGLTDAVTNLVGALILLVALVIGMTTPQVSAPPPSWVDPQLPDQSETTDDRKTVDELIDQIRDLHRTISSVREQISVSQNEFEQIQQRAEEFLAEHTDNTAPPPDPGLEQ